MVCTNDEVGRRIWMMGDCCIGEVEEYKYLVITIERGKHGGFKSMGDRMKEANGLIIIIIVYHIRRRRLLYAQNVVQTSLFFAKFISSNGDLPTILLR